MLIIIDRKIPAEAKSNLFRIIREEEGKEPVMLELVTEGLVYPAISGHPDIFFFKTPETLIIAPNLPQDILKLIILRKIPHILGISAPGSSEHHSSFIPYNAAIGEHHLVHRLEYTDPLILEHCHYLKKIHVKQGYTACNLLFLKDDHYITSDTGTDRSLLCHGLKGIYVSPEGILLPGFSNGFIAGAMGVLGNRVFVAGNLGHFPEGEKIRDFLVPLGYTIHELYDGPLFDGGPIMFI